MQEVTEAKKEQVCSGITCFVILAQLNNVSIKPTQVKHLLSIEDRELTADEILLCASKFGLKAKAVNADDKKLVSLRPPYIAQMADGSFFIVAKCTEDKALLFVPGENKNKTVSLVELEEMRTPKVILLKNKKQVGEVAFGIKWFVPHLLKYKKLLIEVLVAALVMQILGIFSPMITQVVIDKVFVHKAVTTLDVLTIGMIIIAVFEALMALARNIVFNNTTCKIDVTLGAKLFSHLFQLPLRYFETRRVGDTIARVRELENIRHFLTGTPLSSMIDILFLFVYFIVMFFYSSTLSWVVIGSIPFFVALSAIITPVFKARLEKKFSAGADQQSYLYESVSGVQTVKSFALENTVQRKWEDLISEYINASYKTTMLSGNAGVVGQTIQKLADLAILWFGAHLVMDGRLTVGQLIAFRMLSSRVSGPILRLVSLWQEFQQAGVSIKRISDIFNAVPEPVGASKVRPPDIKGKIAFEKVRFRYAPNLPEVIRDMSFEIKPGEIIGIVGKSGSGKSTLSKLVQRLYIPELGKILIDGQDISNGTLYQLEGSLNGAAGRFEWIVDTAGKYAEQVSHRMFVIGGTMNGVPIKP